MTPTRLPRKYIDADRTQIDPEWLAAREAALAEVVADPMSYGLTGSDIYTYLPEHYDRDIPERGAWILVREEPHTELRQRFRVPLLSMWRARPHRLNQGVRRITADGFVFNLEPRQAVITTPGGELNLWAHEYVMAGEPRALLSDPDATLHTLGGQPVLDPEQLFYLTSRGIPTEQAVLMLFDSIENTDVCYVSFPEEITSALAGVGAPMWAWSHRTAPGHETNLCTNR